MSGIKLAKKRTALAIITKFGTGWSWSALVAWVDSVAYSSIKVNHIASEFLELKNANVTRVFQKLMTSISLLKKAKTISKDDHMLRRQICDLKYTLKEFYYMSQTYRRMDNRCGHGHGGQM
jgi:hypothetical protein